jgi:UDP-N-acetylmuramoylalanine--D-glutamate ligase
VTADSVVVLELSSFQLQVMTESPHVAVVTVVTPDHLDVHRSMEEYIEAKRNIVRFQKAGDIAVLNYANEVTRGYAEAIDSTVLWFNAGPDRPGVRVEERRIIAGMPGEEAVEIGPLSLVPLRGQHNIANACAAIAAVMAMGVEAEVIRQALPTFSGVEHRLEFVRQVKGVRYYNDSIATTPERATAGVLSFDEPLVVIAGGRGKNLDMSAFGALLADRAHTVLLVGESGAELRRAIEATGREVTVIDCGSLEVAVSTAAEVARPGDIVLLAPAYTSFDQFPDYAARGRAFKDLVLALGGAQ